MIYAIVFVLFFAVGFAVMTEREKAARRRRTRQAIDRLRASYPHASDCAVWVSEPCDCITGRDTL